MIPEQQLAPPSVARAATALSTNAPIRVLLVEDDPDAAAIHVIALTSDPSDLFKMVWCSDLSSAMIKLTEPVHDVILLDLGLPEMSGYRSLRAIELMAENALPVVILTSDDSKLTRDLTIGYGSGKSGKYRVCSYLVKNRTSSEQLRQALRAAVYGFGNHGPWD